MPSRREHEQTTTQTNQANTHTHKSGKHPHTQIRQTLTHTNQANSHTHKSGKQPHTQIRQTPTHTNQANTHTHKSGKQPHTQIRQTESSYSIGCLDTKELVSAIPWSKDVAEGPAVGDVSGYEGDLVHWVCVQHRLQSDTIPQATRHHVGFIFSKDQHWTIDTDCNRHHYQ